MPGCIRVVKRENRIIYRDPPNCQIEDYTEVVELPRVEKRVETENYIVEKLSTGDIYVQYRSIFEELDRAFSNFDVGTLFLLTGPPRTGKSYAAEYFAKKWGREIKVLPPGLVLSKKISKLFTWVRSTNGVLVLYEGGALMMRGGTSYKMASIVDTLLKESNDHVENKHRGIVVLTTNMPTELIDYAAISAGRFEVIHIPSPTQEMLRAYSEVAGIQFNPAAKTIAELKEAMPSDISGDVDYEIMPPFKAPAFKVSFAESYGTYSVSAESYGTYSVRNHGTVYTLLAAWAFFGGSRQVWYIYGDRDPKFVINALEDNGAVGVVDERVSQSYVKYARPLGRGLLLLVKPRDDYFPEMKISVDSEYTMVKIMQLLRPCVKVSEWNYLSAFWRRCPT